MSEVRKGARRPKNGRDMGSYSVGNRQIKAELVFAVLIAGLYALFLLDAWIEGGQMALILSMFLFVIFTVFAYMMRSGTLKGQQQFKSLVYVFMGLSALSMIWEILAYLNFVNSTGAGALWAAYVGVVYAVISIIAIAAIMYVEKDSLKKLYIDVGDKNVIGLGAGGFVLCLVVSIIATYLAFGGNTIGQGKFIQIVVSVVLFGVLAGIVEEVWFRGLLLNRIVPLLGESQGNIYQAAVFGVFETLMYYTLTGEASFIPAMFIIGAFTGYYWGRATLKAKSMLSPMLLHAGLYILLLLPLLVGLAS